MANLGKRYAHLSGYLYVCRDSCMGCSEDERQCDQRLRICGMSDPLSWSELRSFMI